MICDSCIHNEVCYSVAECLNYIPGFTCDDYEPQRPQGEWIDHQGLFSECDQCHCNVILGYNFCPNCGAKMRGEAKKDE